MLVETARGPAILWSFGADPVDRLLRKSAESMTSGLNIRIKTNDFTAPVITVPFEDTIQQTKWMKILKGTS